MEGKIIPSIILAAGFIGGIALFGNQVGDGVNALLNKDRIVTVKGLCEKEVKAYQIFLIYFLHMFFINKFRKKFANFLSRKTFSTIHCSNIIYLT